MSISETPWPRSTVPMRSVITINVVSGHGGVITPSSRQPVGYGRSKMFVIRPWDGYAISDIEVDGVTIGPVTMYMFTNVTEDHTIRAVFRKKRPAAPQRRSG